MADDRTETKRFCALQAKRSALDAFNGAVLRPWSWRRAVTIRILSVLLLAVAAISQSGCAMCCGVDDYTYPTYGGKWQRTNAVYGRVGSTLSDAGDTVIGEDLDRSPETVPAPGPDPNADPISYYNE